MCGDAPTREMNMVVSQQTDCWCQIKYIAPYLEMKESHISYVYLEFALTQKVHLSLRES